MNELSPIQSAQLAASTHRPGASLNDDQALASWLGFVQLRNTQTFRSYRTEVTRFRIFLATVHRTTDGRSPEHFLRDATEIDVALYEAHLLGRLRKGDAVTPLVVPQPILNHYGRKDQPFVTIKEIGGVAHTEPLRLKASSISLAMSILNAMYRQWMQPDPQTKMAYVGANPVKRIKTATNRSQRQVSRNFPIEAVQAMMDVLDQQVEHISSTEDESPRREVALQKVARQRWIVALLFGLWGRRAEMANLKMRDFMHDGVRWVVHLERKGGKEQTLPVAPWVVKELSRYRGTIGLSPLPSSDEEEPAIRRLRERSTDSGNIDSDLIYREIIDVSQAAAAGIRSGSVLKEVDSTERELIATRLSDVSPHWFRHSGASIAINSGAMSLENASKMLNHGSTAITASMYYHPDDLQIEEGMEKLGAGTFAG